MDRASVRYADGPAIVASVNLAATAVDVTQRGHQVRTGIGKIPVAGPVTVRAPGSKADGLGSGLVGDLVVDRRHHGGDDQAVYAYADEDYRYFETLLDSPLTPGRFGENLTTRGLDVNNAILGETWRIGDDLILKVRGPRIPCNTFRAWMGVRGWLRTFSETALSGAYLSVVSPGTARSGDRIAILDRPAHGVTVWELYRALTTEPERWPAILAIPDEHLGDEARHMGQNRSTYELG